jgi:hypothetical protein
MNWWYIQPETMPRVLLSRAFKWHETWEECEDIQGAWSFSMRVELYKEYCDKVSGLPVYSNQPRSTACTLYKEYCDKVSGSQCIAINPDPATIDTRR